MVGRVTRLRLVLFLLVWFSCAWFGSWEWNPNNAVRLFAAVSLVEQSDATIDEFATLTIDKASFGGHTYSDKAPGMTLMALPAVWLADWLTGERSADHPAIFGDPGLGRFLRLRLRLAVASGAALMTAAAAVALFELALSLTGSRGAALFASLGYALGTPSWGWSTTILGHAPVAALFVLAVWGIWVGGMTGAVVAGLSLGWAAVIEHQAVLAGGVLSGWALARWWTAPTRTRLFGAFLLSGAAALLPLLFYNLLAFGTAFRVGYQGVVGWEGMHQGLFGLTTPRADVLCQVLVGPDRGLLWVAPVLALAPLGLARLGGERRARGLALAAGAAAAAVFLVNAAYVYWDGGNATGPRLSIPATGLLAIGLAPYWAGNPSRTDRVATVILLALSAALNATIASAEVFAPPDLPFPIWSAVIRDRFLHGDLRTVASDWWGWSTWAGFALWAVVALPLAAWLARHAGRV